MAQAALKNCPVCKKPSAEKYRPFCSKRCADIDLGGWLGEKYRVPTEEGPGVSIQDSGKEDKDADIE